MRRIISRLQEQRGQVLIMFIGIFTVIAVVGLVVVDFGLWFSERRGAQTDADMSALAGAQAYVADLTDTAGAFDDAVEWAVKNGVDPAKIDPSNTSNCSAGNSCVDVGIGNCYGNGTDTAMPWVESDIRHNTRTLFGRFFELAVPDIGATARACVGSPRTAIDLSPFGVQTGFVTDPSCPDYGQPLSNCLEPDTDPDHPGRTRPVYGAVCILKTGAQNPGCQNTGGQRGQLTLGELDCEQTSANTLRHDFHYGAKAGCSVDQEVNTGTGNLVGLLRGLQDRLSEEGLCDQLSPTGGDGYDDFDEVFSLVGAAPPIVPSADNVFSLNECSITNECSDGHTHTYTPRVLDLVLIDQLEQGEQTATITGFAGFYVIGCVDDDDAEQTKADIEDDLTNIGPFLNRCDPVGAQDDILGIFVEKLAPPLNPGDPDPNLPLSIVLVR
jgi:hypothetical protein